MNSDSAVAPTAPPRNVEAVYGLAQAYARELDAQLGTLSLFTKHGGEIGRVHEHFLRSVLRRFLPATLHVGSGFVALPDWTSTQLDILVHPTNAAPLFAAGDLVVVDGFAGSIGAVEVKTDLDKRDLIGALNACLGLKRESAAQGRDYSTKYPFYGVYAAGGMDHETFVSHFQGWVAENLVIGGSETRRLIPDVIYMRGRRAYIHGHGMSDPYVAIDLKALGEGLGLLSLVSTLYEALQLPPYNGPWWLQHFDSSTLRYGIERGEPGASIVAWR